MLAKAAGRLEEGEGWAAMQLPLDAFIPISLPRTATIYPIRSISEATQTLAPWTSKLSAVAWDLPQDMPTLPMVRICPPGQMQRPVFPRLHDGKPMWASIAPKVPTVHSLKV